MWLNNTAITYDIPNGLRLEDYIYIINLTDDYDNFITDTVIMKIVESGNEILFGNYFIIFLIVGIISLVIIQKRKR
ncbi:MAG: hypothetical protein ACFFDH_07220 [Promethearchaeota archaeon]